MFRSSLFVKTFTTISLGVVIMCAIFYLTTVPMIRHMGFTMQERAGTTLLDNITLLIRQSGRDLAAMERSAMEARKRELRHLVDIAAATLDAAGRQMAALGMDRETIDQQLLTMARNMRYGRQHDYIWIADYSSRLISHPDDKLLNADFSTVRDVRGNLIVPPMVEGARTKGEGFHSYWWRRLGSTDPIEKLSYYRNLADRKWVIGTGVYIDDIRNDTDKLRQQLIAELRTLIHNTRFSGEGYLFIFDADKNMIIHPNPNIEGTNFAALPDPLTNTPIADELIAAANTADKKLAYKWDKPDDPGNYVYDKIAWTRHIPEFDWYVSLSVYTRDLEEGAATLTNRIVVLSLGALLLAVLGGYLFVRSFTSPIARMAESARQISGGDLSRTIDLEREDEIGELARAFNTMVHQLRSQIHTLEERVKERTAALSDKVEELQGRNHAIEAINAMGDMLKVCRSHDEVNTVVISTMHKLFASSCGEIFRLDDNSATLEPVAAWNDGGATTVPDRLYRPDDCWAVRRGKIHSVRSSGGEPLCGHLPADSGGPVGSRSATAMACIPMTAQGRIVGVLHCRFPAAGDTATSPQPTDGNLRLLEMVAEHTALSLSNIELQQTLQEQSSRDPLTGLYNRRYTLEEFQREERRIARHGGYCGLLLMDIDFFKRVNDTHGHDAGDAVLKRLASILGRAFRTEDTVCRWGGEEFLVLLSRCDLENARAKAEKLRATVERELRVPWGGREIAATISVGVACYPAGQVSLQQAIEAADQALYRAKEGGRNRVEVADLGDTA